MADIKSAQLIRDEMLTAFQDYSRAAHALQGGGGDAGAKFAESVALVADYSVTVSTLVTDLAITVEAIADAAGLSALARGAGVSANS